MANYATNVVSTLPSQILEVLRDQRMSLTQLSTYYSVKYRSSLNEKLKGAKAANIKEYLEAHSNLFEVHGDIVKARPKNSAHGESSQEPPITSIRYAHISKAIQNILNETQSKSLDMGDLETAFQTKFKVGLVSVIGMPTSEYLERKANVFEIEDNLVRLQKAFQKETELKIEEVSLKGALSPIAEESIDSSEKPAKARQSWADLPLVPESSDLHPKPEGPIKQKASSAPKDGSATHNAAPINQVGAQPKENDGNKQETTEKKSENLPLFAVDELVRIFEEHSEGPIMHSSVLCSLFMQQLGASVTEISGKKPMELFRQHPEAFIWLSSGNVALARYHDDKSVQQELKLLEDQPKCVRVKAAAAEASLPVPDVITEEVVINYIIALLQENEERDSIYISALCGRFMQRFRKPVTEVVGCKPTDFIKKHNDIFYLEKGGHVKLVKNREVVAPPSGVTDVTAVQKEQPSGEASQQHVTPVTVPPPTAPWRRNAPEADKSSVVTASVARAHGSAEVQQKIDDFCTRLRKQLFFRVTEVISGAPVQVPGSIGRPAEIPLTIKITNLPKELEAEWLPQLLHGVQQVLEFKFGDEVDGVALEGEGVHCRLRNFSVGLFVCLAFH